MKKQQSSARRRITTHLKPLASSIGDFIHYWGFRRIHGEIWAIVYLSPQPISGADLVKTLGVSKALVSPALKELLKYKLIFTVPSRDPREKCYTANPDFMSIIKTVLATREQPMIEKITSHAQKLESKKNKKPAAFVDQIDEARFQTLQFMVLQAQFVLGHMLSADSLEQIVFGLTRPASAPESEV